MSSTRDLAIASISAAAGAVAAAAALRFLSCYRTSSVRPQNLSLAANGSAPERPLGQSPFDPAKREGYISWDDYFMAIAFLSAERSKDPNRQELATTASLEVVLMTNFLGQSYVVHAEVNAILNTNHASAAGQKLYVTMFPCNECAKIIIQSGVSEVIYFVEKRIDNSAHVYVASHKLLSMAGVKVRKHQPQMTQIPIKFQEP
ncbi:deoxycytidylate deaminase isoform X1 [Panicum miliaceum]|uniref:dCMP deaminase n=1 Tax=Panicum miliaceum TaxID=4540 RepID=A0A3L6QWE5_PANMI|nr:deoxycytidylate deaminase isoform X1 [Panicum miliaceum]